jgi:hypothetical protein
VMRTQPTWRKLHHLIPFETCNQAVLAGGVASRDMSRNKRKETREYVPARSENTKRATHYKSAVDTQEFSALSWSRCDLAALLPS